MTTGAKPTKRKIKAVLIDVVNASVSDIEFEPVLSEYYRLLNCELVQSVRMPWLDDDLMVDEEGLYRHATNFFSLGGNTYVGNGLIVGVPDANGGETDTSTTAAEIAKYVRIFHTKVKSGGVEMGVNQKRI